MKLFLTLLLGVCSVAHGQTLRANTKVVLPDSTRDLASRLSDVTSVKDFGAKGDGTTDDAAAWQATVNSVSTAGGGSVIVPRGTYVLNSTVTIPVNVQIEGFGATVLAGANSEIMLSSINSTTVHMNSAVRNLIFQSGTHDGVIGIKCAFCADLTVQGNTFVGLFTNVSLDRGGNGVIIDNNVSRGSLIKKAGNLIITSTDDANYVNGVYLTHYYIFNLGNGVQGPSAIDIRRGVAVVVDDVEANDLHVGGDIIGVVVENDSQGCKISNLVVGAGTAAVTLNQGTGPSVSPSFIQLHSIDADQEQTAGILIQSANWVIVDGANLTSSGAANGASGILIQAGSHIILADILVNGFNGTTGVGITIGSVNDVTVHDSKITDCTIGFGFNNSPTHVNIHDNQMSSVPNPITGTVSGGNNWLGHNSGALLGGDVSPAVPASTSAATNNTGYTIRYYLTGGTITGVSLNGVGLGASASSGQLQPGETIAVTYSVAPTWKWIAEY